MKTRPMKSPFTGWHMAAILVSFFAVVVAVNLIMARLAISGFGGTVVDNSYVASQKFNGWLAKARQQEALGWKARMERTGDGHLIVRLADKEGRPVDARLSGQASHPLGLARPFALRFERQADGSQRSLAALPAGRWTVALEAVQGQTRFKALEDVR